MKTRQSLSHSHTVTPAATVSAYDGWRDTVSITVRDEHDGGTDEVTLELPENVFEKLVDKVNAIVAEKLEKLEDLKVE
jgi:VCBS repeat-containing protein